MPPPAPKNPLIESVKGTFARIVGIISRKNQDYAASEDVFRNFNSSLVVRVPVERAILVRLMDKITRISNLLDHPPAVSGEALEDSIDDAIGYLAILRAHRELTPPPAAEAKAWVN